METGWSSQILQLKYELGSIIGQYPAYYEIWCRLFRRDALSRFVTQKTDIVIEGFPRSGNTFAVAAFSIAQDRNYNIARHTHKIMQIIRAVEMNIPAVVLIRPPTDAVLSLNIRQPHISLEQGLRNYVRYYNGIKPFKSCYLLAEFNEVVNDFGSVINRLNNQFGTTFTPFHNSLENRKKTFKLVEKMGREHSGKQMIDENIVGRPSKDRNILKINLRKNLEEKALKDMVARANATYAELVHL